MQKRTFLIRSATVLALAGAALCGCTTTSVGTPNAASSKAEIDQNVERALDRLYAQVPDSRELIRKADGMLVFPQVLAAGLGVGGEYGKGLLRTRDATVAYYSLASLSVGFQAGAQSKTVVILFMTKDSLEKFRNSKGWAAGADASVALLKVGANGAIDTRNINNPVQVLALTNTGVMVNLSMEGTKISRLDF